MELNNKMKNKIISKIFIYMIISLMFIVPMNISFAVDNAEGASESINKVSAVCSPTPPTDVKSSFILSVVFMCLPGILEKTMEKKEIECDLAVCSYEAVKNNLDPSFCEKEAAYKTCKYWAGEIFAIPPLSIMEYIRQKIASILANPIGFAYAAGISALRYELDTVCAGGKPGCDARLIGPGAVILAVNDILAVAQTFMEMMENGFSLFDSEESSCDQLSEIKEELEGLVENG